MWLIYYLHCIFAFTNEIFYHILFIFLVMVFSCSVDLVVVNSFHFFLLVKLFISPLNLNDNLVGENILCCMFFPFITFNISCHSLLTCKFPAEKWADSLVSLSNCLFLLLLLRFSLTIAIFICLSWCGPFGVHLVWDSLCFLDLDVCFFSLVRELFRYYFFK